MTYTDLKSVISDAYADFSNDIITRQCLGADLDYSFRQIFFVKCIYKVLLNQDGDEDTDLLTQEEIQDCIKLFNKYSGSSVQIEYT